MGRRKSSRPFVICSFIIHGITALLMMLMWPDPHQIEFFPPDMSVDITHVTPPKVVRPERLKEPEPVEQSSPEAVEKIEVVEKPLPPKPKPTPRADWLPVDSVVSDQRGIAATAQPIAETPRVPHQPRIGTESAHVKPRGNTTIALAQMPEVTSHDSTLPPTGTQTVALPQAGVGMAENSPEVGSGKLTYWHKRGAALADGGTGNSWSSGGSTGKAVEVNYVQMMNDMAQDVAEAAISHEVDLVFILDKTGSMEDNVRGIRAYIDLFFDQLRRADHDTAVGLVTFADAGQQTPKTHGVTTDHGKFKNWLHKIDFEGGGDLAESGLDALMMGLTKIKFRKNAQRFFVYASDGGFHDADYDGQSDYSLDEVIDALQRERVRVDVIGLDYLPIKQIAMATGGTWRAIPGKGYLEYIPPLTLTAKMLSEFGILSFKEGSLADELVVYVNRNPRPTWFRVEWKILNPLGEKCYGPFEERMIIDDSSEVVKFSPPIDATQFRTMDGTYTVIYHLENDLGHQSILRRAFDF